MAELVTRWVGAVLRTQAPEVKSCLLYQLAVPPQANPLASLCPASFPIRLLG